MFAWICPQCGREVPPFCAECPNCAEQSSTKPPQTLRLPAAAPPDVTEFAGRPPKPAARRKGLPAWQLTLLSALAFGVLGGGGFLAYRHFSTTGQSPPPAAAAAPAGASASPLQKLLLENIEVTGLRLVENAQKKVEVQFVVVNHSPAPLMDLAGTVTLRPSTAKPGGEIVGAFAFRVPALGPYESRDLKATMETKMRAYELPDWQFLRADLEITSPR